MNSVVSVYNLDHIGDCEVTFLVQMLFFLNMFQQLQLPNSSCRTETSKVSQGKMCSVEPLHTDTA